MELPAVSIFENYDPLEWWKVSQNLYPTLAHQAQIYLTIPSTSVSCKKLFSVTGNAITDRRNRLVPSTVKKIHIQLMLVFSMFKFINFMICMFFKYIK